MRFTTDYSVLLGIALGIGALRLLPSADAAFAQCVAGWDWVRSSTFSLCPARPRLTIDPFASPVVQFQITESLRDSGIASSSLSGVLYVLNLSLSPHEVDRSPNPTRQPFTNSALLPTALITSPRNRTTLTKRNADATRLSIACTLLVASVRGTRTPRMSRGSFMPPPKGDQLTIGDVVEIVGWLGHSFAIVSTLLSQFTTWFPRFSSTTHRHFQIPLPHSLQCFRPTLGVRELHCKRKTAELPCMSNSLYRTARLMSYAHRRPEGFQRPHPPFHLLSPFPAQPPPRRDLLTLLREQEGLRCLLQMLPEALAAPPSPTLALSLEVRINPDLLLCP